MVQTTEEQKAKRKAHQSTPEYKAKRKTYHSTPEQKAKRKAHQSTPEYKAKLRAQKEDYEVIRIEVLSTYSKRHSKSNIPCCRCCGENFHIDFLALDHIAGKKEMDSEPELVKLGYSSKLRGMQLLTWIKNNNFPKGFQILCHMCNFAKGMQGNNNICPHERK